MLHCSHGYAEYRAARDKVYAARAATAEASRIASAGKRKASAKKARQNIVVNCLVKTTLAPSNPATTMLYAVDEHTVVEMVPQIPGQIAVDGSEQETPARLKLVNFE